MKLRADQNRINKALKTYQIIVLAMGRRWGKTVLGLTFIVVFAWRGARCAWVVPSYKNGRPLWKELRRTLGPHKAMGAARLSETERTVEFAESLGGGFIGLYTGDDNCDAMRGDAFDLVVIDEAAKLSESAWSDAILPTLADRNGKAVLISTPRGRNWFWRMWVQGQDTTQQRVRSFTAPTADNPNPRIKHAAEQAKEQVSDRTYRQEWLAEFIDDGGGVFRNVRANVRSKLETAPNPAHQYAMGVDIAKSEDFTVCIVVDLTEKRVVAFDRWNKSDWALTKLRIYQLARKWNAVVWLDSTGVGSPVYDDLVRAGLRIHPYTFTTASKPPLIDNAVLIVEQGKVSYPDIPVLIGELEALEYYRLPSGHFQIRAPDGMHDDAAMAFCLACWPLGHQSTGLPGNLLDEASRGPMTAIRGATIFEKSF